MLKTWSCQLVYAAAFSLLIPLFGMPAPPEAVVKTFVAAPGEANVLQGVPDRTIAIVGDSSSGAALAHVFPGGDTRIIVVNPYHYYRTPMDSVEPFSNAGDDEWIVPEAGTAGRIEVLEGPKRRDDASWEITVRAPQAAGNWIMTCRTIGIPDSITSGRRPRTIQLRVSTRIPIEDYVKQLED